MKVYSEENHRGNELLKNSGKGTSYDSAINRIQWGDLEDWSASFNDESGAGLAITLNSCKRTKIGKIVLIQFDITYPTTANTNNSGVNGWSDFGYAFSIYTSLISLTSIGVKLRGDFSGGAVSFKNADTNAPLPNATLSGKRILFTGLFMTDAL